MNQFFEHNNGLGKIIITLSIVFSAAILGFVVRKTLLTIANKSKENQKQATAMFLISIAKSIVLILIALAFYIGKEFFEFSAKIDLIVSTSTSVLLAITLGVWVYHLIDITSIWFNNRADDSENATSKMLFTVFKKTLKIIVIAIVAAQVFQIVSQKPLTPILASFGIVGAAVALASQDTFKNFFGSFVLASDKPFEIGDRIAIDGYDGVVESIGMRSTRIRTLDDHLVTFPNGLLANKSIQNISKRNYIKRSFTIGITYDTKPEKIKQAIDIIKNILSGHEGMNPEFEPKVYFKELNTYSLDIMVIYWFFPAAYWDYMELTQKINLQIVEQFNNAGIAFAFPTQTIDTNKMI